MTPAEARALVAARIGYRSDLDATIATEMTLVQQELLEDDHEFKPWFLFTDYTNASFITTVGQDYVSLPTDFLLQIDDTYLYWQDPDVTGTDNSWRPIRGNALGEVMSWVEADSAPTICALLGRRLYLKPTPQEVWNLRLFYYRRDSAPTGETANLWLTYAADWLVAQTAAKIAAEYLQDEAAANIQAASAQRARKRVFMQTEARMNTGFDALKGGDD